MECKWKIFEIVEKNIYIYRTKIAYNPLMKSLIILNVTNFC